MITGYNKNNNNSAMFENKELMGLSTDTKPTEQVPVNALFLELDTGDFYYLESSGGITEETLFDGTVEEDRAFVPTALPSGEMTVVYDGTSYDCQPKTLYVPQTGMTVTYYGATITLEELPQFDWSEYPFSITLDPDGDVEMTANFEDRGEHAISISAIVETPAVWKKVGEGSSPTPPTPTPIEGDLENGCTIQPSAWEISESHVSVDVPFFNMQIGQTYVLYLDGESINTATVRRDEISDGEYLEYEFGQEVNPYRLSFVNTPNVNTTRVSWNINPPNAVTIRLDLFQTPPDLIDDTTNQGEQP